MTLGWGILGTGRVADASVAPAIAATADAVLVASMNRDRAKAELFAEKHGGRVHSTYEELLGDPDVSVVYVATPNALHAEQVVMAARAGKHVFCDKPLATTVDDARRAVEACDRAGVKLGINFQTRHHEGFDEIRRVIADGEIGDVLIVECEVSPGRGELGGWRADPALAAFGAVNNLGVHAYDLVRYLLGSEVAEVGLMTNAAPLETIALALLRFESGALAYVNANQAVRDYQPDIVVYGSEGRILGHSVTRPFVAHGTFTIRRDDEERTIATQTMDAFQRSVAAFNAAVLDDEVPNASGLDGLRSVELTSAMRRAVDEGRLVAVTR